VLARSQLAARSWGKHGVEHTVTPSQNVSRNKSAGIGAHVVLARSQLVARIGIHVVLAQSQLAARIGIHVVLARSQLSARIGIPACGACMEEANPGLQPG